MIGELESGAAEMAREEVDLVALMKFAEVSLGHLARGRVLSLNFEFPDENIVVLGDRMQLERAIDNLLSVGLETDGPYARLTVRDTGIGIPVEEQHGLFQKFFRSTTAQAKAIQGAGLGLSIVSGIVASHGGRVGVDSAHLRGTTFTVLLPLHGA